MKIRTGFVSNSSSTSFLIISKKELNKADFLELMGIARDSPIADLFSQLYDDVINNARIKIDFNTASKKVPVETLFEYGRHKASSQMLIKLKDAQKRGFKAYYGLLSSDDNNIQSYFCTDSFEVENEKIYFNCLDCVW